MNGVHIITSWAKTTLPLYNYKTMSLSAVSNLQYYRDGKTTTIDLMPFGPFLCAMALRYASLSQKGGKAPHPVKDLSAPLEVAEKRRLLCTEDSIDYTGPFPTNYAPNPQTLPLRPLIRLRLNTTGDGVLPSPTDSSIT